MLLLSIDEIKEDDLKILLLLCYSLKVITMVILLFDPSYMSYKIFQIGVRRIVYEFDYSSWRMRAECVTHASQAVLLRKIKT